MGSMASILQALVVVLADQAGDDAAIRKEPMQKSEALSPRDERLIRIDEVLRRLPVSRAGFYAGIRSGRYPKPVRIGERIAAWRESEISALINSLKPVSLS